jgi:hypothetical protein
VGKIRTWVVGDMLPIGLAKTASRSPMQKSIVIIKGKVTSAFTTAFQKTVQFSITAMQGGYHWGYNSLARGTERDAFWVSSAK